MSYLKIRNFNKKLTAVFRLKRYLHFITMFKVHDDIGLASTDERPPSSVDQQEKHSHTPNHNSPESPAKLTPTKDGESANGSPQPKASGASSRPLDGVTEPKTASEAFSMILESVGSDGRWQWYLFFITAICGNFTAPHNLSAGT